MPKRRTKKVAEKAEPADKGNQARKRKGKRVVKAPANPAPLNKVLIGRSSNWISASADGNHDSRKESNQNGNEKETGSGSDATNFTGQKTMAVVEKLMQFGEPHPSIQKPAGAETNPPKRKIQRFAPLKKGETRPPGWFSLWSDMPEETPYVRTESSDEDSDAELDDTTKPLYDVLEPRKPLPKPRDFVPQVFSDDYTWEAPVRIRYPMTIKEELFDEVNLRFKFIADLMDDPFIPGKPWYFVDEPTIRIFSRSPRYKYKTEPAPPIPECCARIKAKFRFAPDPPTPGPSIAETAAAAAAEAKAELYRNATTTKMRKTCWHKGYVRAAHHRIPD